MEELVKPGDLVLVSNRYETQMCAIDCGAQAIVVCCGSAVPRTIVARAQEKGCAVLATPYDTYAAGKLISQCAPISYYMTHLHRRAGAPLYAHEGIAEIQRKYAD